MSADHLFARIFHEIAPGKATVNVERLIKALQDFQRRTLKYVHLRETAK